MLDTKYKKVDIAGIVRKGAGEYFKNSAKGKDTRGAIIKKVIARRVSFKEGGEK